MSDPITPLTPEQEALQEIRTTQEGYIHRTLVGLDQFANVATGGLPDETISSRMARWDTEDSGWKHEIGHEMSAGLDMFQKNHGAKAEVADLTRAKLVEQTEKSTGTLPKQGD